jgi:hypothetical protein
MRTSVTRGFILIFETTGMFILDYVIYRIVAVILEMFWDKIVLRCRLYTEVQLRKCCLGQSEKSEIPYYLMINVCIRKNADINSSLQKWAYDLRLTSTYPRVL